MNSHSIPRLRRSFWLALTLLTTTPLAWGQAPPIDPPEPPEVPRTTIGVREVESLALPTVPAPPGDADPRWQLEVRRAGQLAQRTMRDVERQIGGLRFGYAGPDARRLLVIPSVDVSDDAVDERRNDLAVMSTILARAARPEKVRRADLLFEIDGWRAGSGRELEAMMLDGYGAVFLLGVDYPLMKSPSGSEATAEPKKSADGTWKRTSRELLGQVDHDEDESDADSEDGSKDRAFDTERVTALEQRLIETLGHASNIRGLSPDNWIVVQVTGRAPRGLAVRTADISPDGARVVLQPREPRGASVLTFRVKKSAVDDFSANRLKLEEFSRAVEVSRRLEKPVAKP